MLERRLTPLQAVSLNMSMMVGIGPFVTIPLFFAKLDGPQAMLGWVLGAVVAIADGLVWSELAASFPGSGGTYHFFDAIYGPSRLGRALKFLFVWQFLFSGPLELASGMIGFADYAGYLRPSLRAVVWEWRGTFPLVGVEFDWVVRRKNLLAVLAMAGLVALAYRRIGSAGRLMVVLWVGMLALVTWIIAEGMARFDPALAFDFPPGAWHVDGPFLYGLGGTLGLAMYSYLGYYQVCYLGDEVVNPSRTIPRSIAIAVAAVAAIYVLISLGIIGTLPWREVKGVPDVASLFMARLRGPWAGSAISVLVMWSAVAACFAALLGYSRIPYAAAKAGHFFGGLAKLHPTGEFPHRSLLLLGAIAAFACLGDLGSVIDALLASRILIQFVGQAATVFYLRKIPGMTARMPFRMPLYPLPALLALVGWLWVLGTASPASIVYGVGSLAVGAVAFAVRDRSTRSRSDRPEA